MLMYNKGICERQQVIGVLLNHIDVGQSFTIANNGKDKQFYCWQKRMLNKKFRSWTDGSIIIVVREK